VKAVNKYFFIGLILFYLLQWFSPNKPIYFASYALLAFFFYLASKDIVRSLAYTLILSLFSETTFASSLFKLDPDIGAGYFITPFTVVTFLLLVSSIRRTTVAVSSIDWLAVAFLLWNSFLFFLRPHPNTLYGIMSLGEMTIAFLLLRISLGKKDLFVLPVLLVSMLLFQLAVGLVQFLAGGNIGLLAESVSIEFPFGLTAIEEEQLYRISGISGHPNMFAVSLLTLVPYLFLYRNWIFQIVKFLWVIVIFATYSRLAWVIGAAQFLYLALTQKSAGRIKLFSAGIIAVISLAIFIIISPSLFTRFETIPEAFDEYGSVGIRKKSAAEAWNLFVQSPLIGVGPNMFLAASSESPVTDLFRFGQFSPSQKIHNLFLEIAAETGIVGLLIFLSFVSGVLYLTRKVNSKVQVLTRIAFIGYLIFAQFHPLFLIPQLRILYLLSAIMMIR